MAKPLFKQDLETAKTCVDCARVPTSETTATDIFSALHIKTQAAKNFIVIALANARLMDRKQQDYGPENIADYGTFGVVVRMNDKAKRLKTLYNKGLRRKAVNESIQDTFRDISNYAIIALMLENDMWPNE